MIAYLFFSIFCFFLSFMLNWLLLRFSKNLGVRNNSELNQVRWKTEVKPSLGGLSFFLVFLICIAVSGFISETEDFFKYNQKLLGIMAATTLGFIIGLADDAYNTNPLVKFMGQLTCAFILILSNLYIVATGNYAIDYLITVLWVVGLMNSINMLDNMDAITTSASIVIVASCLIIAFLPALNTPVSILVLLIGVLGSLFGFLYFNWNPAKIYMGDSGSQFLGVFLAGISILILWNEREATSGMIQLKQFVLPLLVFTVPLMDTATVFIRRLLKKQSPFVGGRDHTTHQLVFFGFSEKQTARILILIGVVSSLFAIALKYSFIEWTFVKTLLAFGYFFVVFGIMQIVYNIGKKRVENE